MLKSCSSVRGYAREGDLVTLSFPNHLNKTSIVPSFSNRQVFSLLPTAGICFNVILIIPMQDGFFATQQWKLLLLTFIFFFFWPRLFSLALGVKTNGRV